MAWRGRATALKLTTRQEFHDYLARLTFRNWRPSGMTLHNTAEPSRARWNAYPGEQWLRNLKSFYMSKGWAAGPHAFVDGINIWVMTDFNVPGVHSPSWNGTRLGIEMVANFATEDDESGIGLMVKKQAAQLFAVCHEIFGWEPSFTSIKLHKEDPATDHDCPGRKIDKAEFVRLVTEYMGDGGDLLHGQPDEWQTPKAGYVAVEEHDNLNIRETSSASAKVLGTAPNKTTLSVTGEAYNGATKWYHVKVTLEGSEIVGWGAADFIRLGNPPAKIINENITATVFGGPGDYQDSAYGGRVDGNKPGVALPYKWRTGKRPLVRVTGPRGTAVAPIVDLGPWNLDNPEYVINGNRPLAEKQYSQHTRAQNGSVPSNDAGIDLTPALARVVGIAGKGKVNWEFTTSDPDVLSA